MPDLARHSATKQQASKPAIQPQRQLIEINLNWFYKI
jgi:hypothetical protein